MPKKKRENKRKEKGQENESSLKNGSRFENKKWDFIIRMNPFYGRVYY